MAIKNCLICKKEINRSSNTNCSKLRRGKYAATCSKNCSKIYTRVRNYFLSSYSSKEKFRCP